ncbi:diacylglycerol kinase [Pseudodesulfovibrio sp. JC047]|uniref:diacylglycerol kinase n=1 Tax=Pseudodesulfovibrio sp. JC047 TaxID=2683199 RepID=UPI0013D0BA0E|nr:diacylglycerol kinase [Pseudodesulfovibrio sp. JC047]NDV18383.1 diacylglycerol kinase [Pseudodesulfovibrio sp. JC047]
MTSFLKARMRRIFNAFTYSVQGFGFALKQKPFQEELLVCVILVPVALWLDVSMVETLLLVGSLIGVLVAEIFNTAIEAVVDRIGPEKHVLSGAAKDLGSVGVLVAILWAVGVWGCVVWGM